MDELIEKVREVIANGCGCHRECEDDPDLEGYCGCRNDAAQCVALAKEHFETK